MLTGSAFKITISEKWQTDFTLASAGIGLTIAPSGRISGGSVTNAGIITVSGNNASIGTAVTIVLTPTPSGERLAWTCSTGGNAAMWAYVPTECRH